MSDRACIIYRYDGSFAGFLTCVYESFYRKEVPADIVDVHFEQFFLYPVTDIESSDEKAKKLYTSLQRKLSEQTAEYIYHGFLCARYQKEILLYNFIRKLYRRGASFADCLADPDARAVYEATKQLYNEAHSFKEFARFTETDGALVAVIAPKNRVLPLLANHFADRYNAETFMIYDETHKEGLVYQGGRFEILPIADLKLPPMAQEEAHYRQLWQTFFDAIAIEARKNPKLQQSFMPKRYWKHLPEMQDKALSEGEGRRYLGN
ncbi:MAG: TIGR03915 family putative DNA repair protein [Eubacterium sp.]|nr:TIGR03915 family putative DNA repair protein [Eubacterium sp.]